MLTRRKILSAIVVVAVAAIFARAAHSADVPTATWKWAGQAPYGSSSASILPAIRPPATNAPPKCRSTSKNIWPRSPRAACPICPTLRSSATIPLSGEPLAGPANAFARGAFDVPSRWYDAAIPYEFPEVEMNVSSTGGKLNYITRTRLGYFYDCLGDWRSGRLVLAHRTRPNRPGTPSTSTCCPNTPRRAPARRAGSSAMACTAASRAAAPRPG